MAPGGTGWPADLPLTVVIPALNAAATLGQQLDALRNQTYDGSFEVIVVDNGSTDDTSGVALQFASPEFEVRVVSETRRGVNLARNAGVEAAQNGLIALCDGDDMVFPEWLASLAAAYEDGAWLAGDLDPMLLNSAETRAMWGVSSRVQHRSVRPFIDTAFGGNCAFTRAMWEAVGRFDESLSGHGDETEFFLRAWSAGFRVKWAQGAVIHYRLRPGLRNMARQRYRKGKSQVTMMSKAGAQSLVPTRPTSDWKSWAYIALMSPVALISREVRFRWVRSTALRAGGIVGRIQARVGNL